MADVTSHDPNIVVAQTLKRLYPHNPDVVLGREARTIVAALNEAGCFVLGPDPLAWSDDEYDRTYLAVDARLAHEARHAFAAAMAGVDDGE